MPILAELDRLRQAIVITTLTAAIVAAIALSLVFRSAQGRISRQTVALVDATRRDPLTGLLNHGALVGELAVDVEQARSDGRPIGIALIDIDGFRLLNETYGHDAGDRALLTVAEVIATDLPATMTCGRYGPDEFLIIVPADQVAELARSSTGSASGSPTRRSSSTPPSGCRSASASACARIRSTPTPSSPS